MEEKITKRALGDELKSSAVVLHGGLVEIIILGENGSILEFNPGDDNLSQDGGLAIRNGLVEGGITRIFPDGLKTLLQEFQEALRGAEGRVVQEEFTSEAIQVNRVGHIVFFSRAIHRQNLDQMRITTSLNLEHVIVRVVALPVGVRRRTSEQLLEIREIIETKPINQLLTRPLSTLLHTLHASNSGHETVHGMRHHHTRRAARHDRFFHLLFGLILSFILLLILSFMSVTINLLKYHR